jgi:hypothetical protein
VTDLPVRDHIPPHLQLRERAQVTCPRRVGFELGPSHKTVAAFGVCRAYRFNHWDQGSSTPFYFLDISYSDWNTDQGSVVEEASLPVFEIGSGAPGVPQGPATGCLGLLEVDSKA